MKHKSDICEAFSFPPKSPSFCDFLRHTEQHLIQTNDMKIDQVTDNDELGVNLAPPTSTAF